MQDVVYVAIYLCRYGLRFGSICSDLLGVNTSIFRHFDRFNISIMYYTVYCLLSSMRGADLYVYRRLKLSFRFSILF